MVTDDGGMPVIDQMTTPAADYDEKRAQIDHHFRTFRGLIHRAREHLNRHEYAAAAVHAHRAAIYAVWRHTGLFVSTELEEVLLSLGRTAIDERSSRPETSRARAGLPAEGAEPPHRVLHVLTQAATIGGHGRMVWRWIQHDRQRSHHVAFTRQGALPVPSVLREAVQSSGGRVYVLNRGFGSLIDWAARLRRISTSFDLVVLHANPDDIIPIMAFASKLRTCRVALLDHADHVFWLGRSVSDIVVSLRSSGAYLALTRRHLRPDRSVLLPIILEPTQRVLSRSASKARLGIADDAIVLLSVARSIKYRQTEDTSFIESLVPVLERHSRAVLLVVGPDDGPDWEAAQRRAPGQVKVLGPREETRLFCEAADIYVDSFPIVSNTSLLEAGSYGVPLVSRCPFATEPPSVLCADSPGLDRHIIRVANPDELRSTLSRLIEDDDLREQVGEATREEIARLHTGDGWRGALEQVYHLALSVTPMQQAPAAGDTPAVEELDLLWPSLFGAATGFDDGMRVPFRGLPVGQRLAWWTRLLLAEGTFRPNLLAPEWLTTRVRSALTHAADAIACLPLRRG